MSAEIVGTDVSGVARSAKCVADGGIILYPTETVYGLGGCALNDSVARRIRTLKGSTENKPMLVLTDEWNRVESWFDRLAPHLRGMLTHELILAITLLLPGSKEVPAHLLGEEGLVGIRRTNDPFCRAVIARSDAPVLSTSANRTGESPPTVFRDVDRDILRGVDVAVDAVTPLAGVPSTIVRVNGHEVSVVREGAVDAQTIHTILGMG